MKPKNKIRILWALLAALIVAPIATSCKSPATVAYQVSKGSSLTVETALAAWNDYVKSGRATLEQESQAKAAFEKYQAAQVAVLDAAIVYSVAKDSATEPDAKARLNLAIAASGPAFADLVKLLQQFKVIQ